ncbi:MAG: glycosyltransferase family 2 protein [Acidimicrobiales bacterium]
MTAASDIVIGVLFVVVAISVIGQLTLYVSAAFEMRRIRQRDRHQLWRQMLTSPLAPRISVLVPAYNEEVTIADSVAGLLALTYPNLEVVVVNDGSSDATMERLTEAFELSPVHTAFQRVLDTEPIRQLYHSTSEPRLVVADKLNGGKADALNAAINLASGDLVCAIDADTLVSSDALQQLVPPFLADASTVAVGGTIRLVNGAKAHRHRVEHLVAPTNLLVGAQAVEYARAFLVGRLAWNPLGGNLIISGAFGLFRRNAVLDVGGYEHRSVGEDMELVVRLRRHAYDNGERAGVVFSPDPVAFTEAPDSIRMLARQRNRWFRGLLDVLLRHRRMIGNPRYGTAGTLAMPYFAVVEAFAPILEVLGTVLVIIGLSTGWIAFGDLTPILGTYMVGMCATYLVLILDQVVFATYRTTRDRLRLVGHVVFEQFVFRPATAIWRLWGLKLFLEGRTEWGVQHRKGFASS